MAEVETLLVTFDAEISEAELPLLRGAMIHATEGRDVLFHNHAGDGNYRYAYPLVQYKRVGGKAAIMGVGAGIAAVEALLADGETLDVRLGRRNVSLTVDQKEKRTTDILLSETMECTYAIHKYFPLNQENYQRYMEKDSIVERYALIEKCIVGNILSMAKSLGIVFQDRVRVALTEVADIRLYQYKEIKMMGFDLTFKTNVRLPESIGLGKDVSLGSGTIKEV